MRYGKPTIQDFGSIVAHTFQTPGQGTKSHRKTEKTDKWAESTGAPGAGS